MADKRTESAIRHRPPADKPLPQDLPPRPPSTRSSMAKARAIIKRRKSVQNIKKITRTMELIATARFKKALDRATEAEAYTRKIAEIVADLGETSGDVSHPLLEKRDEVKNARLLILTSNRGLAGGYNGNVLRLAGRDYLDLQSEGNNTTFEIAGKRGINYVRFRG